MSIVTIIIPVYNKIKYLQSCLDTLINQSVNSFEIICVDDASTDGSTEMLASYERNNECISVIKNEVNIGAARSRNLGMRQAKGKYLFFLDADDFYDKRLLEECVIAAENASAEIVVFNFAEVAYSQQSVCHVIDPFWIAKAQKQNNDILPKELYPWFFITSSPATWNKMYLRSYIEKIGAEFQDISSSNDVFFSNYTLLMADRITCVKETGPLLFYRSDVENQIIQRIDKDPLAVFKALDETYRIIKEIPKIRNFNISFIDRAPLNLYHALSKLNTEKGVSTFKEYALSSNGIKKYGLYNLSRDDFLGASGYRSYLKLVEELGLDKEFDNSIHTSDKCDAYDERFFSELARMEARCALWGYGKMGKDFYRLAQKYNFPIQGILDGSDKFRNSDVDGIMVKRFDEFDWDSIDALIVMIKDRHTFFREACEEIWKYKPDCIVIDAILWDELRLPMKYCVVHGVSDV